MLGIRLPLVSAALLLALAPAAVGGTTKAGAVGCNSEAGVQTAATAGHRFALHVGMPEQMYTPAQVRKMHPKHGEVMLAGAMGGTGMSMGGSMRHVEVQICSRKTGAVVTSAHPTIALVDNDSTMKMTMKVPVAVMKGIEAGAADLHYGNNVAMTVGHRYTITVTLKGERAVFHVKVQKGM